jgi:hypothetical protein
MTDIKTVTDNVDYIMWYFNQITNKELELTMLNIYTMNLNNNCITFYTTPEKWFYIDGEIIAKINTIIEYKNDKNKGFDTFKNAIYEEFKSQSTPDQTLVTTLTQITNLPLDVLGSICTNLDPTNAASLSATCTDLKNVSMVAFKNNKYTIQNLIKLLNNYGKLRESMPIFKNPKRPEDPDLYYHLLTIDFTKNISTEKTNTLFLSVGLDSSMGIREDLTLSLDNIVNGINTIRKIENDITYSSSYYQKNPHALYYKYYDKQNNYRNTIGIYESEVVNGTINVNKKPIKVNNLEDIEIDYPAIKQDNRPNKILTTDEVNKFINSIDILKGDTIKLVYKPSVLDQYDEEIIFTINNYTGEDEYKKTKFTRTNNLDKTFNDIFANIFYIVQHLAPTSGGQSKKINILGRNRKIIMQKNIKYIMYKKNLIKLSDAKKLKFK